MEGGDEVYNRQPVLGHNNKGYFYKCPCGQGMTMCDKCGVCFDKNRTGKEYTIYVKYHGTEAANGLKNLFTSQEVNGVIKKLKDNGWVTDKEREIEENPRNRQALQKYDKGILQQRKKNKKK